MSAQPIPRPARFNRCYGCGPDNPRGLGLVFAREGEAVVAVFTPSDDHGGYGRVVHGGVTATIIDEALGWALYALTGKIGMTTDLHMTFSAPLLCGEQLTVRGSIDKQDAREAVVKADVIAPGGRLAATGIGTMRLVSQRAVERLGGFKAGA